MTNLAVVIACHNEEKHIGEIVACAKAYAETVIVVDDHSSDRTAAEGKKAGGLVVANVSARKGVGFATMLGINQALKEPAQVIVTLDGDGQHDPREIPKLAEPIVSEKADMVIGSRSQDAKKMPFYRRLGNEIINITFNLGSHVRVSDSMCGFRAYRARMLEGLEVTEDGFEYIPEILLKAMKSGARIQEVPIACIYHESFGMNSSMMPVEQGVRMVLAVAKWKLRLAGRRPEKHG
jgi:glycosyltransferase involved in cell wall biosynthesis